jgi:hypothetical protein
VSDATFRAGKNSFADGMDGMEREREREIGREGGGKREERGGRE